MLLWKFFRFIAAGLFLLFLKIRGIMLILCMIEFFCEVNKLKAIGTSRQPTPLSIALSGVLSAFFLILGLSLPDIRIFNLLFL